jgi:hypothetical protein
MSAAFLLLFFLSLSFVRTPLSRALFKPVLSDFNPFFSFS